MKTTSLTPPALLITGLLLSGCSGLDNPSNIVGQPRDFFGAYDFEIISDTTTGACNSARGRIDIDEDGKVTGEAFDDETNERIKISGSMDDDGNGGILGSFAYPPQTVANPDDFDGEYTTFTAIPDANQAAECDLLIGKISLINGFVTGEATDLHLITDNIIKLTGFIETNGEIEGHFFDKETNTNLGNYSGIITTSANGTGKYFFRSCVGTWNAEKNSGTYSGTISADPEPDSGSGPWIDNTFGCAGGSWSAVNATATPTPGT